MTEKPISTFTLPEGVGERARKDLNALTTKYHDVDSATFLQIFLRGFAYMAYKFAPSYKDADIVINHSLMVALEEVQRERGEIE